MIRRRKFLVYSLPGTKPCLQTCPPGFEVERLTPRAVETLFRAEESLRTAFLKFLEQGFLGLVWHEKGEWASYAWVAPSRSRGVPHLPAAVRKLGYPWVFYCQTREAHQRKGLFRASLGMLAAWVREDEPRAEVFIDTEMDNLPSRRAILDAGFVPHGVVTTVSVAIPRVRLVAGQWDRHAPHVEGTNR